MVIGNKHLALTRVMLVGCGISHSIHLGGRFWAFAWINRWMLEAATALEGFIVLRSWIGGGRWILIL